MNKVDCVPILKALAEPTRLRIMGLLLKRPKNVNDLSKELALSQYNTSKHLKILRGAGLLEIVPKGKTRTYHLSPNMARRLTENKNVLKLDCCTFHFGKMQS